MSRNIAKVGRRPMPPPRTINDYTPEEQAARLNYDEIPRRLGLDAARVRIAELFDADISVATLKRATESGHLRVNLVGGRRKYSDRALYDYVVLNSLPSDRATA